MTTPDSQEMGLLPCPFCGNDVNDDDGCFPCSPKYWEVRCGNPSCFAHDPVRSTREDAITAWNTRPREAAGVVDVQDAARYRWLRDAPATSVSEPIRNWLWTRPFGADMACLDAAIDAALVAALGKT